MIHNDFNSFPKSGRILGIDWGAKRIGLAISDSDQNFVFTRPIIATKNLDISAIIKTEDPDGIIVGLPLRTDGTESETTARVREFAAGLATDLPILLFDESLTSFAAEEDNMERSRKKTENLDSVAAKIMLENALAQIKRQS